MLRSLPRRKRGLLVTIGVGGLAIVIAVLAFIFLRPAKETYLPGGEIEGLTTTMARSVPDDAPRIRFHDVAHEAGIDFVHFSGRRSSQLPEDMGSGAAWFIVNHDAGGILLNNAGHPTNHWLEVSLKGTESNCQGIGARLRVVARGQVFLKEVGAQPSYLSQNSMIAHFGLGDASHVDTVEVRWPRGQVSILTDLVADRLYSIVEGQESR